MDDGEGQLMTFKYYFVCKNYHYPGREETARIKSDVAVEFKRLTRPFERIY